MLKKLTEAFKWRYELYFSGKIDVYAPPLFYIKQAVRRRQLIANSPVVYIYANKRNVGDYISYEGIKTIIDETGPELYCAPVWSSKLERYLNQIKERNPNSLLVIGGGGLLQPVFEDFWRKIIASNLNFLALGIGINKMNGRGELPQDLLMRIIKDSLLFAVRDDYSYLTLSRFDKEKVRLGICPSVNYVYPRYWQKTPGNNNVLLHLVHPSDLRLSGADLNLIRENVQRVAASRGLKYAEHTNICNDDKVMLRAVQSARIVVTSRLHGCIMSFACGVPFLPLLCDDKMAAFNRTHTGVEGLPAKSAHDFPSLFTAFNDCLSKHSQQQSRLLDKKIKNESLGNEVKRLVNGETD